MTATQKQTIGVAIASLVLGILGLICIGPLGSIPAIICGHVAKSRINKNPDALTGDGMALAGLILGYVQIGVMVFMLPLMTAIAIPSFMRARTTSQANACINNLRQIESAKEQYGMAAGLTNGAIISLGQLVGPDRYLKQWPICPLTNASGSARPDVSSNCYQVNPLGVNAACKLGSELPAPQTHQLPAP